MKKEDVPQDEGLYGRWHGICYATDEAGNYVAEKSAGWEPVNIANGQAWEEIEERLADVKDKVRSGRLSPLAYHMEKNLMDVSVLAGYTGMARWRIKRHLRSSIFNRLDQGVLARYAQVFGLTVQQLSEVP